MLETLWIWRDERVAKKLSWYLAVSTNRMPAKYMICRRIPVDVDFNASEEELWDAHRKAAKIFDQTRTSITKGGLSLAELERPGRSLMDLKVELVKRMLRHCNFCRWNCRVDRREGSKKGACMLDWTSRVSTYFHHLGEELPIRGVRGSGTIFFTSCNMRCSFCLHPDSYVFTTKGPVKIEELYERAISHISGDGSIAFPENLYVYAHDGRPVKVMKIFKHYYDGEILLLKPLYAPPLLLTPEHQVLVYVQGEDRVVKMRAAELQANAFLLIPRPKVSRSETFVLDASDILSRAVAGSTYLTHARERLPTIKQAITLLNSGYTSREVAEAPGYHPVYVRNLASKVKRHGLPKAVRRNSIVVEEGQVRVKTEKKPGIPARLEVTKNLAELLGYYCAKGHVTQYNDRSSSYKVVFSFGKSEAHIVKRVAELVKEIFGLDPEIVEGESTLAVELNKTSLSLFFKELCGSNCYEKRVPYFIFCSPPEMIESFLVAYNRGNGCVTASKGTRYISSNTVSQELAMGLYALHIILGHVPSFNIYEPAPEKTIGERSVSQSTLYYVKVNLERMAKKSWKDTRHVRCKFLREYVLVPLNYVVWMNYSGPVYNLEVDDECHSYTANFLAVGNCQNGDISKDKDNGLVVDPSQLAMIIWELRTEGCHNINLVGGEPTIHLHTIVEAISLLGSVKPTKDQLTYLWMMKPDALRWRRLEPKQYLYDGELNAPILWNSNMYMSGETLEILRELVDIWLPDFKFGSNACSIKLARTPWYWETVSQNHKTIYDWGEDIVVRHLVMPNHVECCTKRVLSWIAENMPEVPVNVMDQYHPDCFADPLSPDFDPKYSEISRRPTREEILESYRFAKRLGIVFESISLEKSVFGLSP
ncbi:MAG: hypothetical protein QXE49_05480 [Nitrososphaerota archaeon]